MLSFLCGVCTSGIDVYACFIDSYPDEFESTRIIGDRQFQKAVDLFSRATEQLKGKVDYRHAYLNFSNLEVTLPKQGGGSQVVKTCPAAMGFAFAAGTTDGPGAFDFKQGDDKVEWMMDMQLIYYATICGTTLSSHSYSSSSHPLGECILEIGSQLAQRAIRRAS